jgi:predicted AlkP superfamily pyrophosphatase or phosphodiesterase
MSQYPRRPIQVVSLLLLLTIATLVGAQPLPGKARLNLVIVIDGLRPDSITGEDTPVLFKLRQEGVNYQNGHSVFPTVTRVNAAAIATGRYPGSNGILGNRMYVSEINPNLAFSNDNYKLLVKLDELTGGKMLLGKSLGEILDARGLKLAVVSSGSGGQALLLNPRVRQGVGITVNGYLEPGKLVAYPPTVNSEILSRFGPAPRKEGRKGSLDATVNWTQDVLREYVLPELRPAVIVNWMTEPDHTQHAFGVGSPEARGAIRNTDRQVELILKKLEALGLRDRANLFIVSDHGFTLNTFGVNLAQELIKAGLKAGVDSDDLIIAGNGQSASLHVKGRDRTRIKQIVNFLYSQRWADVVFTTARGDDPQEKIYGWVDGTFSLELIHLFHVDRGPDIVLTFPWNSERNSFGVEGTHFDLTARQTGPLKGARSGHGGMSPWSVRNTFFTWGVDFKRAMTVRIPASNVDLTPTILALNGINEHKDLDGRVLLEAVNGGPREEEVPVETRLLTATTTSGPNKSHIQVSTVGRQRYITKSWRAR